MFQYRLYPTKKQSKVLESQMEECRWLYNHLLEKRRDMYEQTGVGLTCYQQINTYPILKQERPFPGFAKRRGADRSGDESLFPALQGW